MALIGADAHLVEVEVHATQGVPNFTVVGLPAKSVREAEQRTRSALLSSEQRWPPCRTVANLAPASLRKEGTHFDLAIAIGILAADRRLDPAAAVDWVFVGELGLDGSLRPVRGALPAAMAARRHRCKGIVCPAANAAEAALVDGIEVVPVVTLGQAIAFVRGKWAPGPPVSGSEQALVEVEDMADVHGQPWARQALEVAAAGGHNLLMRGSPGCGKTMLARRLPGILPAMSTQESLDVTRIHSVAGLVGAEARLVDRRPFRTPHHNVSTAGLIGGGPGLARPGEVALAHNGVLFMDELPLFRRDVLESLRGPLEDGVVRIVRSAGVVTFPCRFSLVGAMNPCPCGFGEEGALCACTATAVRTYRSRISGPLLDRFDLQVSVTRLSAGDLMSSADGEASECIRVRVEAARMLQRERYGSARATNASVPKRLLLERGGFGDDAYRALRAAIDDSGLTGRGMDRVFRVARTIADLMATDRVGGEQVELALGFRCPDERELMAA